MPRLKHLLLVIALLPGLPLRADWKQDVGYDRLVATFTTGVPNGVTAGVTQVEAGSAATETTPSNNYLPNPSDAQFTGKTITNLGNGSGTSPHATGVGGYIYGNTKSLVPGTTDIDAYSTASWLGVVPYAETRLVQNHSWVARAANFAAGTDLDRQALSLNLCVDIMANQGAIVVAGADNTASAALPVWLCQGYNLISVGRSDGQHSAGFTIYDGTGRIKPDIVSVATTTSDATAQISSAAALIGQKLTEPPYALAGASLPRVTKALLLAGATKEEFPGWARTETRPLDIRYGAGEANVLLSYRSLVAGPVTASNTQTVPDSAWANASLRNVTNAQSRSYYFDIPAGSVESRFSAALIWHRPAISNANGSFSYSAPANLDLALYAVDAGSFSLGASIDTSQSTVDNVEYIHQPTLPPGRYALVVTSTSGTTTSYALAWRTSPTVTVAATIDTADELTGSAAVFTLTRTGPVTSPLVVPLSVGGSAVSGVHYTAPPATATIPAGQSSVTVAVTPITDDIAQGDRSVTLTVATDYSLSAGAASSAAITIQDKPYDAWRFACFSTAQLADETISGANADPDADGIANLVEYALDTEPLSPNSPDVLPQPFVTDDHLAITYHPLRAELVYTPQWSPDLIDWFSGAAHTTETTEAGNVTSTAITPLSEQPRQFLRLQIANP